ncbi:MAG: hypothetical protein V8S89_03830 [Oscillospiraceae bacterium]
MEAFEDALEDADDAPPFWFALADTQWKLGRLTDEVRAQALALLTSGETLPVGRMRQRPRRTRGKRCCRHCRNVCSRPSRRKRRFESHVCTIQTGNSGIFMQCSFAVKLRKPMVWVVGICCFIRSGRKNGIQAIQSQLCMLTKNADLQEIPKDPNEIDQLPYIQIFSDGPAISVQLRPLEKPLCEEDLDEIGYYPVYEIGLIFTSQRSIPKSLVYLGNYQTLWMPKGEVVYTNTANVPVVFPKEFEEKIIDYYLGHNLRQYAIYQRKE